MTDLNSGKKIFILYPNSFISSEIIIPMIDKEYEIYTINDHKLIQVIYKSFTNAIIFINIDEKLTRTQWEETIETHCRKDKENKLKIGIFTYNENKNSEMKYTETIKVPCGYTVLRQRPSVIIEKLTDILEKNQAKENRKFIRVQFETRDNIFTLNYSGQNRTGFIHEISSVGMTIVFDKPFKIEKHNLIEDIQLNIKESKIKVSGVFLGNRSLNNNKLLYVFIFDRSVKNMTRSRLKLLINRIGQENIMKNYFKRQPLRLPLDDLKTEFGF